MLKVNIDLEIVGSDLAVLGYLGFSVVEFEFFSEGRAYLLGGNVGGWSEVDSEFGGNEERNHQGIRFIVEILGFHADFTLVVEVGLKVGEFFLEGFSVCVVTFMRALSDKVDSIVDEGNLTDSNLIRRGS